MMLLISAAVSYHLFGSSLPQLRGRARAAPTALRYADEAPSNSSDPPPLPTAVAISTQEATANATSIQLYQVSTSEYCWSTVLYYYM